MEGSRKRSQTQIIEGLYCKTRNTRAEKRKRLNVANDIIQIVICFQCLFMRELI
jgi:hypothetical protein